MPATASKKRSDRRNDSAPKGPAKHRSGRSTVGSDKGTTGGSPKRRKIATYVSGHAVSNLNSGKDPTKSVAILALETAVLREIHKPQFPDETDAQYSTRRSNEAIGVGAALRASFKVMRVALLSGRKLYLPNIGTIERYTLKSRTYRHPKTHEVVLSTERFALRLTTSPNMRKALLELTPC